MFNPAFFNTFIQENVSILCCFKQYIGATHNYKNSRQAKLAIYELGEDIKAGKLPAHFGPLTFVFTGSGNVSQVNNVECVTFHIVSTLVCSIVGGSYCTF